MISSRRGSYVPSPKLTCCPLTWKAASTGTRSPREICHAIGALSVSLPSPNGMLKVPSAFKVGTAL